jgi:hypothetical protein
MTPPEEGKGGGKEGRKEGGRMSQRGEKGAPGLGAHLSRSSRAPGA